MKTTILKPNATYTYHLTSWNQSLMEPAVLNAVTMALPSIGLIEIVDTKENKKLKTAWDDPHALYVISFTTRRPTCESEVFPLLRPHMNMNIEMRLLSDDGERHQTFPMAPETVEIDPQEFGNRDRIGAIMDDLEKYRKENPVRIEVASSHDINEGTAPKGFYLVTESTKGDIFASGPFDSVPLGYAMVAEGMSLVEAEGGFSSKGDDIGPKTIQMHVTDVDSKMEYTTRVVDTGDQKANEEAAIETIRKAEGGTDFIAHS